MEGNSVYTQSYKEIEKLIKGNTSGNFTIDYNKLDERTASELRLSITKVLTKRKGEIYRTISGAH